MGANLIAVSTIKPERLSWLSRGRLALGKLAVLDGDPGLGKSTLTMDWAAAISRGDALPDGEPRSPSGVVVLSAEDGEGDTIRPRLEAAGADLERVFIFRSVPDPAGDRLPAFPEDVAVLEDAIVSTSAVFVVVDPLMAYLGGDVNAHRDQDVRRALAPLAALADRTGAAILLVRHLNKAQSADALRRGGGSIGIIGAARCGLLLAADPDDPERRVLAVTKGNLARPAPSLAFRLEAVEGTDVARVSWDGESHHRANDLLAVADDEDRSERDEAADWIRDFLANGPRSAAEVITAARKAGIAEKTLRRAKQRVGVRSQRTGGLGDSGAWMWVLGDDPAKVALTCLSGPANTNGHLSHLSDHLSDLVPIDPPPGSGIYICDECRRPRARDLMPCPACGATGGHEA